MTTRVTLRTNMPFGAISAITGDNRGSMDVAMQLYTKWSFNPLKLLTLDDELFHDERLWMAYKDVCRENIDCLDEFITAVRSGKITNKQALHAINNRGDGLPKGPWTPEQTQTIQPPEPTEPKPIEPKPTEPKPIKPVHNDVLVATGAGLLAGLVTLMVWNWVHK